VDVPMLPLLAAGLVAIVAGLYFGLQGRRQRASGAAFTASAATATAEVTDLRLRHQRYNRKHDDGFWLPVVRFTLPDGRVVEAETMTGSMPAPAQVGDRVDVRYDPEDPRRVNLARGLAQPGNLGCLTTALAAGLVGVGLLVIAGWFLLTQVIGVPA
jgi:hypothetical protein